MGIPCAEKHEARIAELLALEFNWNSYRAKPVNPQSVAYARPFINRLDELGLTPWITPESDGGIMLGRAGTDDYSFSFCPNGNVEICLEVMSLEAARDILECAAKYLPATELATEAQRAETSLGSVHEGAGLKGNAHD